MCLGIPGEVLTLDVERPGMATVNVGGARRQVNVMLIEEDGVAARATGCSSTSALRSPRSTRRRPG